MSFVTCYQVSAESAAAARHVMVNRAVEAQYERENPAAEVHHGTGNLAAEVQHGTGSPAAEASERKRLPRKRNSTTHTSHQSSTSWRCTKKVDSPSTVPNALMRVDYMNGISRCR